MTIPIAPLAGAAAMFVAPCPSGRTLLSDVTSGNLEEFAYDAKERFTCVDSNGTFRPEWLLSSYGPVIAGVLVHKFVGGKPLNVNGMLARAKIPFVRL